MGKLLKVFITILIILTFIILLEAVYPTSQLVTFGVSFSPRYAKYLGLDWQKTFLKILDELKVTNLRIPSYWNSLEPEEQKYDFYETDFMLMQAAKRGVRVVLVVGARQPRWPECQYPAWARKLSVWERQQRILQFVQKVVGKYKSHEAIWAWQVENEPFVFWFGENCDPPDKKFLQAEINLVKKIDPKRLIIVTDSGEWGLWTSAMQSSDLGGISLYKKVHIPNLGYTTYPFPAFLYQLKSNLIRRLFAPQNQKTIITELQAEPWTQKAILDTGLEEQTRLFTPQDFKDIIQYTQKTGFDQAYLWGVEWWYWIAHQGYPGYLDFAKQLFQ